MQLLFRVDFYLILLNYFIEKSMKSSNNTQFFRIFENFYSLKLSQNFQKSVEYLVRKFMNENM